MDFLVTVCGRKGFSWQFSRAGRDFPDACDNACKAVDF